MKFNNMKTSKNIALIKYLRFGLVIPVILILTLTSCTKSLLDTVPQAQISSSSAFGTPSQILAQVNGLYELAKGSYSGGTEDGTFYGGGVIIFAELHADEWLSSSGNTADGAAIYNQDALASLAQVNDVWNAGYSLINNANILISNLNVSKVQLGTTQSATDSIKNIYIGEARFLRALAYLNLVQYYALPYAYGNGSQTGLPLRLTPITSLTSVTDVFSTVGQIYTQIINDLDTAELYLPVTNQSASVNYYRAHKATAIALKTRVYLIEQNWNNVITEASKIVSPSSPSKGIGSASIHGLESSINAVFSGSYTGQEAILFFPFNTSDAPGAQAGLEYFFDSPGFVTLNPNSLVHTDSIPVFSASSGDARNSFITRTKSSVTFNKFPLPSSLVFTDYVPAIRYAEVLLNFAEAEANSGDLADATTLLQAVRHRSSPAFVFPVSSISTQDSLVNTILHERRIELLGEGFRLFDLFRQELTIPSKPGTQPGSILPAVPLSSNQYIWPIPSAETSTNN
jgi:hypothetical protein